VSREHPRRTTPAQIERRRDAVVHLAVLGFGVRQIAEALNSQASTISADLSARWPERDLHTRARKNAPVPVIDWRSEPDTPVADTVTPAVLSFTSALRGMNYRNAFAHAVAEADARNPKVLTGMRDAVAELTAYAGAMTRILDDAEYRHTMASSNAGRDDLRKQNA
jgi:hypothetical protein